MLDRAAAHYRVVLTHDVNTMTKYAYERLAAAQPLSGVIVIPKALAIGTAIEELVTPLHCSEPEEFSGRVLHLPLWEMKDVIYDFHGDGRTHRDVADHEARL